MKKTTLLLLLSSLAIAGCSDSGDDTSSEASSLMDKAGQTMKDAASTATDAMQEIADDAGTAAMDAVDSASDAAKDAMAGGKDLATAAAEGADAAVEEVKQATAVVADKVAAVTGGDDKSAEIYKTKCSACHATGAAGAPKLSDSANWAPRIAQGNAVMVEHAINGFKGKVGYMPPKGGYLDLSDEEVEATVIWMVSQVK